MSARNKQYTYYALENDPDLESPFQFTSVLTARDSGWLAECIAEDWHTRHDGWESSWPVEFVILEDGIEIGRHKVDRETVPQFTAVR